MSFKAFREAPSLPLLVEIDLGVKNRVKVLGVTVGLAFGLLSWVLLWGTGEGEMFSSPTGSEKVETLPCELGKLSSSIVLLYHA